MPGISPIETAARKEKLLDILPMHDWSISKAGIAVGWSETYSKSRLPQIIAKDVDLCRRITEKRRAIDATTGDLRDKVTKRLVRVVESPVAKDTDAIKAADVLGKMNGWMSEKIVFESSERQQQLDASHAAAARQIAAVLLDTRRLPGDTVAPITAQNTSNVLSPSPVGGTSEVIDADFVPSTQSNVLSNADVSPDQSQGKADAEPAADALDADAGTVVGASQGGPDAAAVEDAGDGRGPADGGSMPPMPGGASTLITSTEVFCSPAKPTSGIHNPGSPEIFPVGGTEQDQTNPQSPGEQP